MPLTRQSLALAPEPASVPRARAWVSGVLQELERDDLVFAAELGVTELVTNALLHASAPIEVSVRGTVAHPRIEVSDGSSQPLRPTPLAVADPDEVLITFGRGLSLVAMTASSWGYQRRHEGGSGKTVWFEPATDVREEGTPMTAELDADETDQRPHEPPAGAVTVTLINVPTRLFGRLRAYHFEVRRELRLLALADPDRYPLAVEVTEAFEVADVQRRLAVGVLELDQAIAAGTRAADLTYRITPDTPATMATLCRLFERVRADFGAERLLSVIPDPVLRDLQLWYFGEFVRQAEGAAPTPWTGPTDEWA